jgi:hypothetical protein
MNAGARSLCIRVIGAVTLKDLQEGVVADVEEIRAL